MAEKKHGGKRTGAGRKSKSEEQALAEKLSPLEESAFKSLKNGLANNQSWATKLYFEYMYGKPRETKDITLNKDVPIYDIYNDNSDT